MFRHSFSQSAVNKGGFFQSTDNSFGESSSPISSQQQSNQNPSQQRQQYQQQQQKAQPQQQLTRSNVNNVSQYLVASMQDTLTALPTVICSKKWRSGIVHEQPLTFVCMDGNCLESNRFLICTHCGETDHMQHDKVPLNSLISDVLSLATNASTIQKRINASIDSKRRDALRAFSEVKDAILNALASFEREIHSVYDSFSIDDAVSRYEYACEQARACIHDLRFCATEHQLRDSIERIMKHSQVVCSMNVAEGGVLNDEARGSADPAADDKHRTIEILLGQMHQATIDILFSKEKLLTNLRYQSNNVLHACNNSMMSSNPCCDMSFSSNGNTVGGGGASMSMKNSRMGSQKSIGIISQNQSKKVATMNLAAAYFENQAMLRNTIYDSRTLKRTEENDDSSVNGVNASLLFLESQYSQQRKASTPYQNNRTNFSTEGNEVVVVAAATGQKNVLNSSMQNGFGGVTSTTGNTSAAVAMMRESCSLGVDTSILSNKSVENPMYQRFEFSKTMKDPNIALQFRQIVNGNYGRNNEKLHYRVQLLQPELEGVTPTIKSWSMRITRQLPHWIGFGMCHLNEVKKASYKFVNNEFSFSHEEGVKRVENHGCYFMTTHGWAFAHQQKVRRSNLRFLKDDVINCKFDPFVKQLVFTKNNEKSAQFAIDFETICWNKLYPCVILWHPEDSVELL